MKVSSQHLRLDAENKTAQFQGYKGGARHLLREMAADLVGANGTIRSGYLRLSDSGSSEVNIKAGYMGSGATAATVLIKDLVNRAYGVQASQALEAYLSEKRSGNNKVGTQSFVKLIQKLEVDVGEFRTNSVDAALSRANVSKSAGLMTGSITSLKLDPEVAALLSKNRLIEHKTDVLESAWKSGLQLLFPGSEVKRLGAGGEACAFEIRDGQGAERVYKAMYFANDLRYGGAREMDVGAVYSSELRQSPHLLTPSHFLMGYGDVNSAPITVVRVPADRVKELAKESSLAGTEGNSWLIYGLEMSKAAGGALDAHGQALTHQDLGHIARGLHAGLSDLAAHNTIHCDIKPENVMYNPIDGRTQLIDFGGLQKLSKQSAPEGQKPQTKDAITETLGFKPPWISTGESFGTERDRYAAAVTLLAVVLTNPKDGWGNDATVTEVIIKAMGNYTRSAERPEAVLSDVLAQVKTQNPAMHQQLDSCLQRNPQFLDYLSLMFASAVPGRNSDAVWDRLKSHPFVTAPLVLKELASSGVTTTEAALSRANKVMDFFKNASLQDFRKLNGISGSSLIWTVHTDPSLADASLPMAARENRFRELEVLYHQQHPVAKQVRDPGVQTEEEFAQGVRQNLESAALSRAHALTMDLVILSDPVQCALLNQTVVKAKQAGLIVKQIDTLGRGTNFQDVVNVTDQRIKKLISRILERQELGKEDIRLALIFFPEINNKL